MCIVHFLSVHWVELESKLQEFLFEYHHSPLHQKCLRIVDIQLRRNYRCIFLFHFWNGQTHTNKHVSEHTSASCFDIKNHILIAPLSRNIEFEWHWNVRCTSKRWTERTLISAIQHSNVNWHSQKMIVSFHWLRWHRMKFACYYEHWTEYLTLVELMN